MGEGEKLVRALFAVARELQPSIIFIGKNMFTSEVSWTFVKLPSPNIRGMDRKDYSEGKI